jgi:hypothetical protein
MPAKIELLKSRDFGEIISDTFIFIRENFKPLMICLITFCGFFIVASAAFAAIQQSKLIGVFNTGAIGEQSRLFGSSNPFAKVFTTEYFLSILFSVLNFITMPLTIYAYICLYREKGNIAPTPTEVWGYFKYFFFRIAGSFIILILLLLVGFVLCLLPGIYLYPILALIFPIIIFENSSFSYAFNKSFKLIKNNWWETFGAIFVIGIIVYFATLIILLPMTLMGFGSLIFHPKGGAHLSMVTIIITAVLQSLCHIFYVLPFVTVSLCYFNLSEKAENTGLMGRINKLGTLGADDNLPTEEY